MRVVELRDADSADTTHEGVDRALHEGDRHRSIERIAALPEYLGPHFGCAWLWGDDDPVHRLLQVRTEFNARRSIASPHRRTNTKRGTGYLRLFTRTLTIEGDTSQ